MLVKAGAGLPIVVVQFAKIKMFAGYNSVFGLFFLLFPLFMFWFLNLFFLLLGKISIQNVINATRIFVNPPIPEIVSLKKE
jgi:hypothetical protein